MEAGKIITLGLVATSAGLIMGTVALPAHARLASRIARSPAVGMFNQIRISATTRCDIVPHSLGARTCA
jgi:hypothetical protein